MMKKFWDIAFKEFLGIFKDHGAVLVMVFGALTYALFYAIPYAHEVLRDVPIGVVDLDNTQMSRKLVRMLDVNEYIAVTERPQTIDSAKKDFYSGKIRSYVVIPRDFEHDIFRGKPVKVSMYSDSSYLLIYRQVANGVITSAMTMGAGVEIGKLMKQGLPKEQAMTLKMPFEYVQMPLFNPSSGYASYIYPVVIVLILQQTLVVGIGLVGGTRREYGEPYCKEDKEIPFYLLARSTGYILLYLIHAITYFLIFPMFFRYSMHYNLVAFFMFLIPFLYSVTFFAQCLVTFFKQRETAILVMVVTSLPFVFLPGFVWPRESISPWLKFFADFLPATSAMSGFVRINQMGATFAQVSKEWFVLVGLCVLYFTLAYYSVKKVCK